MKREIDNNQQIKIIEKITDKAIKQVELECKYKPRNYIAEWNGIEFPSGIYFIKIKGQSKKQSQKLILLK